MSTDHLLQTKTGLHSDPDAIFVSLELSRSRWLVTSMSPGSEKMSKHSVTGGDAGALLDLLARLQARTEQRTGASAKLVVIHEAGFDGFWIHRLLTANGIESHVVEPASIAVPRRHRRAKTDILDGEILLRTLRAFKRAEPRVCSMVVPPSPEEEDRRRVSRERRTLIKERIEHVNRIKGLLASQGIFGCEPMRKDFRNRLEGLRTGDGRPLGPLLKAEIIRELDRIDLVLHQIAAVEAERNVLIQSALTNTEAPAVLLMKLKGIGPEFAAVLWLEGLFRNFANRRHLAAYAGLAPSPWKSGSVNREQGISRSGNPRLRTTMVELAWLWLRYQPDSALSRWFRERVGSERGRIRRITIVALARKLLVALWRYTTLGELPKGAALKTL
ncbi:MAG TPA: IS110 family transposase [Gemmatimonadales bacterium]|nr:IS110 family transposase [Gemmatimonadales bacterium]